MHRLRKRELCPIHRSKVCHCHGGVTQIESKRKSRDYVMVAPGVKRFPDGREKCTDSALKRRKDEMLREQPVCYACSRQFSDYRDVDLAHIESKGMNSWKRNDAKSNLRLLHRDTNNECGSRNLDEYIASVRDAGKRFPCEWEPRC